MGAVGIVRETSRPVAQVAREVGINEGTLGNWVNSVRRRRDAATVFWRAVSGPSSWGCAGERGAGDGA
jgi:hypothetical protein